MASLKFKMDASNRFDDVSKILTDKPKLGIGNLPTFLYIRYHYNGKSIILGIVVAFLLVTCVVLSSLLISRTSTLNSLSNNEPCRTDACLEAAAWMIRNFNKSVEPCEDFYQYACSNWDGTDILPVKNYDEKTVYDDLLMRNENKLRRILESPVDRTNEYSYERKIKDIYTCCLDDFAIMKAGGNPLVRILRYELGGWYVFTWPSPRWKMQRAIQKIQVDYWVNSLFTFRLAANPDLPGTKIVKLDLSGFGMNWRYYLRDDTAKIRDAYKTFMRTVAKLLVRDANITLDAKVNDRIETFIQDSYHIEEQLANITEHSLPSDTPHAAEQRISLRDLTSKTNNVIDFTDFFLYMFNDANVTPDTEVVVLEMEYIVKMTKMIEGLGINKHRIINNYLTWRLAQSYVQDLSWEYVHANREFYVTRTGRVEFLGTWKYCFRNIQDKMGDALSALYVKDHFSDKNKPKAQEIVDYLKEALIQNVQSTPWMDASTRAIASEKVRGITDKIGYPDFMIDEKAVDKIYSALEVDRTDYFQNVLNMNKFEQIAWNKQLKEGENRQEWLFHTFDVIAQYANPWNELMVPAGVLQFPMFDNDVPHYLNFGSTGSILGHELLHAVDEIGGYYTKNGTMTNWWSNDTLKNYGEAQKCVIDSFANKTLGPFTIPGKTVTIPVNGKRYARFAISEIGGVRQAYTAFKLWENKNGAEKRIPGLDLTNEQMFFVAYAQVNCYVRNDVESFDLAIRGRVPEDMRTNTALSHLEEFSQAFACPANSPMNPQKKCRVF